MQAIKTEEVKKKLQSLKDCEKIIVDFGAYLATRLNDEIVPMGFVVAYSLALADLQSNTNGFTGQPINNSLTGYPPVIYNLILISLPQIAKAVLPEEFAVEAVSFYEVSLHG